MFHGRESFLSAINPSRRDSARTSHVKLKGLVNDNRCIDNIDRRELTARH